MAPRLMGNVVLRFLGSLCAVFRQPVFLGSLCACVLGALRCIPPVSAPRGESAGASKCACVQGGSAARVGAAGEPRMLGRGPTGACVARGQAGRRWGGAPST